MRIGGAVLFAVMDCATGSDAQQLAPFEIGNNAATNLPQGGRRNGLFISAITLKELETGVGGDAQHRRFQIQRRRFDQPLRVKTRGHIWQMNFTGHVRRQAITSVLACSAQLNTLNIIKQGCRAMTQQNETLNTETSRPDDAIVPRADTANPNRQKRSVDDESTVDRKSGSGGLDSLGGGRLL